MFVASVIAGTVTGVLAALVMSRFGEQLSRPKVLYAVVLAALFVAALAVGRADDDGPLRWIGIVLVGAYTATGLVLMAVRDHRGHPPASSPR